MLSIKVKIILILIIVSLIGGISFLIYKGLTEKKYSIIVSKLPLIGDTFSNYIKSKQKEFINSRTLDMQTVIFDPIKSWGTNIDPKDQYRIPAGVITKTGRIVIAADYRTFGAGDSNYIDRCSAYSDDFGKTWTGFKMVLPRQIGESRIMDGSLTLVRMENGKERILAISTECQFFDSWFNMREIGHFKTNIYMAYSDDNGNSWTNPKVIFGQPERLAAGISTAIVCPGNGIQLKDGTVVVSIHSIPHLLIVRQSLLISKDYGITWKLSPFGQGGDECQIVQKEDDNSIISICRPFSNGPDVRQIYQITDLSTWTQYKLDGVFPAAICQGSFLKIYYNSQTYYLYSSPSPGGRYDRILRYTKTFDSWTTIHKITNEVNSGYSQLIFNEDPTKPLLGVILENYIQGRRVIVWQDLTPILNKLE